MSKCLNLDARQIKLVRKINEKRLREARERARHIAKAGGLLRNGKWIPAILRKGVKS